MLGRGLELKSMSRVERASSQQGKPSQPSYPNCDTPGLPPQNSCGSGFPSRSTLASRKYATALGLAIYDIIGWSYTQVAVECSMRTSDAARNIGKWGDNGQYS